MISSQTIFHLQCFPWFYSSLFFFKQRKNNVNKLEQEHFTNSFVLLFHRHALNQKMRKNIRQLKYSTQTIGETV